MNEDQIKQLAIHKFGAAPSAIERMTFGHCNVVYGIRIRDQEFIIRTNEDPDILKDTVNNLVVLSELGLPVPEVIMSDHSLQQYPSAYMILPKIQGRDLRYELPGMTKPQMTAVAEMITGYQQKVQALPAGAGFGWVPIGRKGPYNSWLEIIVRDIDKHIQHLQHDFTEQDIQTIKQAVDVYKPYWIQVKPVCFLDDLTIKNVIVHLGELQGVIDFDWVCYGDPLYWIGLTQTAIISDIGRTDALFYVEELCRLRGTDREQRQLVDFYSLVHGLQFLGFLHKEEQAGSADRIKQFITDWIKAFQS